MDMFPTGTTVRLKCTFKDFSGELTNPQTVKVKIYDYKYNEIDELVPTNESVGKYYVDFITPTKAQTYIYEWFGEIDGLPSIDRDRFGTKYS